MKKVIVMLVLLVSAGATAHAGWFDDIFKGIGIGKQEDALDNSTIISGLKEALSIGTEKAVENVSQTDGYFANQLIKILLPKEIQKGADVLSKVGYKKQVDDFILSMNRAAEKAAPKALSFFVDAIKEMTFDDARKILKGGDTSATDFFKEKTHEKIYNEFKPVISKSMNEVGVTRSYKEMTSQYELLPFASSFLQSESLDLDHYVTTKAIDGLFSMVAQEEKKIRTDPAARVTDILKTVFGK
jgi:hypothetical protein